MTSPGSWQRPAVRCRSSQRPPTSTACLLWMKWAKKQQCTVLEVAKIKEVSGKLLAGRSAACWSEFPISGSMPAGVRMAGAQEEADFALTLFPQGGCTHLVPKIGVLGIGCRRGTPAERLEQEATSFCKQHGLALQAIAAAASIDPETRTRQGCWSFAKSIIGM